MEFPVYLRNLSTNRTVNCKFKGIKVPNNKGFSSIIIIFNFQLKDPWEKYMPLMKSLRPQPVALEKPTGHQYNF